MIFKSDARVNNGHCPARAEWQLTEFERWVIASLAIIITRRGYSTKLRVTSKPTPSISAGLLLGKSEIVTFALSLSLSQLNVRWEIVACSIIEIHARNPFITLPDECGSILSNLHFSIVLKIFREKQTRFGKKLFFPSKTVICPNCEDFYLFQYFSWKIKKEEVFFLDLSIISHGID